MADQCDLARLTIDRAFLPMRPTPRYKRVLEHVISDALAQGHPCGFVELPVNAKVDATLAILFLSLGE
jgi:hypothetical protein